MRSQTTLTLAVLVTLMTGTARAQRPENSLASPEGVVLLRNGQTLSGNVTKTGDHYLVTKGVTSEVRLPVAAVELVCADLEALYQYKNVTRTPGVRSEHLKLARWCLQHELTARAADQMLMAFILDPGRADLAAIERQLIAAEAPAASLDESSQSARAMPTLHEVEQTIEALPAGSLQQFVTSVQPLLMNRCATNGCHGPSSKTDYQLLRPSLRQSLSRRMTQRNLFATLNHVDRKQPRQSKLLQVSQAPHGGQAPVFSAAETHQMELLTKWVASLVGKSVADLPESVTKPPAFLLQTRPEVLAEMMNRAGTPAAPAGTEPTAPAVRSTVTKDDFQPRDPFDPEIFNRRFRNQPSP